MGCGSIGKRHIGNLIALGVPEVIGFDPIQDRRQEVESQFGIATVAELESAWQRRPTAALIATPTNLHIGPATEAAEHGCHLFIEKPLADSMSGVNELLRIVDERKLVTLVGCNMRFHPGLSRVKQLLDERAIGRVVAARVECGKYLPDWHPLEDYRRNYSARRDLGGGVILDIIHEIDYIRWLLGEVEQVVCMCGQLSHLEIETEDTAALLLRFTSGAIGEVHLDYVQREGSRTCHVIGDEGTIRWDMTSGETRCCDAHASEWKTWSAPSNWSVNSMYVDEMRHFLACLEGNEQSQQDVCSGTAALRIALAAHESNRNGAIIRVTVDGMST